MANIEPVSSAGAILALGPALIAVGGIVVNNWLGSRGQRERANQDALREAAGAYVSAVDVFLDHARELRAVLESGAAGRERREKQHVAYLEAWTQLRARLPVVRISGSESIAWAADQLRYTVGNYADALDSWYARATESDSAQAPSRLAHTSEAVVNAVEEFERAVRRIVGFTASSSSAPWGRAVRRLTRRQARSA
ncbi:hypothetical protein ACQPZQ_14825 [Pseudonocardia sp. CA-142604]|uniref:hypothetical protein n=1 Tax=Pseudonocardia sp. CA-142604 TaxID=3240024 RepID=UPI003D8A79E5